MARGAAHSIQVYTQILAKPKQQGKGAILPDSTLQLPLYAPEEHIVEIRSQGDIWASPVAVHGAQWRGLPELEK